MPSRIEALLERQAIDWALLQDHEVSLIVLALEDARREILADLGAGRKPPTVHQLHVMQAQVDAGILRLQDRMERTLQASERVMRETALQNLIQVVDTAEATFRDHGAEIEVNTLKRYTRPQGLALHRHSIERYGRAVADGVQREIAVSYARGQTQFELAQRVAGVDGVIARHRGRAELIARMETAHAYDEGHQVALEETAAFDEPDTKDPLMKRADEFLDHRNHPFSRLLDGKAVLPNEAWEVPVSGAAERGLVWTVTNGIARGTNYPAHFNDRGRQTPWRKSWDEPAAPRARRRTKPAPAPAEAQRSAVTHPGQPLRPSLQPDPKRKPRGRQHRDGKPPTHPAVQAERRVGEWFSTQGYDTAWQRPGATERTPDFLIEGERVDVYRSTNGNPITARDKVREKVARGQASRVVVSCERHHLSAIQERLRADPVPGLEELWFEVDGELLRE